MLKPQCISDNKASGEIYEILQHRLTFGETCQKGHGTLYKNWCFIPTIIMHF